jgi:hypothetical protein
VPHEAASARNPPAVPRNVERRVAATFGANGFVPSWLPSGLDFRAYRPDDPYNGRIRGFQIDYTYKRQVDLFDWAVVIQPDCGSKYLSPQPKIWTVRGHKIRLILLPHASSLYTCIHRGRRATIVWMRVGLIGLSTDTMVRILGGLRLARP